MSMKLPRILLFLSYLTTTGASLLCKSCWHLSYLPCSEPYVSCPSDNVCVAAFTIVNLGGTVMPEYSITCGTKDQCNATGSLSFNHGTVRTGTSCCSTDNCTQPHPFLPNQSTQKNGLTCRTCATDKSDYCYTSETLECTGEETKCGHMARTLSGTVNLKDTIRGCSTKSFCDLLGNQNTIIDGLYVDMKMYCSNAANDLHVEYLVSIFTAFLTKFMF